MLLTNLFLERGLVTADQLAEAESRREGRTLERALCEFGFADEEQVLKALGDELGLPFVDDVENEFDPAIAAEFPTNIVFRHGILPLRRDGSAVNVATADPLNSSALGELAIAAGVEVAPVLACRDTIQQLLKKHFGVGGDTINELVSRSEGGVELLEEIGDGEGELAAMAQDASVIRLVNELLVEAIEQGASDVHVEPEEDDLSVRFRVDGMLRVQPTPSEIRRFFSAIITRLKIMAHLNIAEKRRPQDGRIKVRVLGREIDVRVSIIPMLHGEGVVLRLLDKERMKFDLARVGMPADIASAFRSLVRLPHGIVLVTGPTGSGKTSTLYSVLSEIKDPATKIITVEDPIEYHMRGISQIQVHSKVGLTFAAGLRSILRHDPDVVLIGEIRDSETASSAMQAALTGHLVFSTLHTNDAASAFTRLVDMGAEPYLVASTVAGALAQRLVRVLCQSCKEAYTPNPDELPTDFPAGFRDILFRAVGCQHCHGTGYTGRTGVFELLRTDDHVRKMCADSFPADRIRSHCVDQGMLTLRQSGWNKVIEGMTSVEEILRIA